MQNAPPPPPARPAADAGGGAHVPVLDGIRGLAIALVIAYHCTHLTARRGVDWVWLGLTSCGWTGVDLFFVLSGFLITGILLDQKGSQRYLRNFYARRVLRIFPLYYAVLVLSFYVLPHVIPPAKLARWGNVSDDAAWYWLYLSNFAIARAGAFRHGVLDISWSLAIEEQFYLLWPAIVLLTSRRTLLRIAVGAGLASLALRVVLRLGFGTHAHSLYVLTPTRLDGLAVGAAIAVLARSEGGIARLRPGARVAAGVAGPLAIAALAYEFWVVRDLLGPTETTTLLTVGFSFVAVFFGAVLVLAVTAPKESTLARFFGSRILQTFGKYSYAMYLFHLPVRAALRDVVYGPGWSAARLKFVAIAGTEIVGQMLFYVLVFAVVLGLAWLSYQLFERWFLELKRFFPSGERAQKAAEPAAG